MQAFLYKRLCMILGLSTYSFPWNIGIACYIPEKPMQARDLIQYAARSGVERVQFGDNLPLHELTQSQIRDLIQVAKDEGVQIEVGMRGLKLPQIHKYLEIAISTGSPFLRVVIDDAGYEPSIETIIDVVNAVTDDLRSSGKILAIENHDRLSSTQLEYVIRQCDSGCVGVCLDTANSFGALEGTYETVRILAPYTINLHIKDIYVKRVHNKMGFEIRGAAAGNGMLNIPAIIRDVDQHGRCISATLEVWSDFGEDIETTIFKEQEMVRHSIQYLKKYLQ
jgi:sugar phosphate isomerase/epimerase